MKLPGLRAARIAAQITQYDLAAKTGLTIQTISNIERGGVARWRTRNKIASALGVKPEELEREKAA